MLIVVGCVLLLRELGCGRTSRGNSQRDAAPGDLPWIVSSSSPPSSRLPHFHFPVLPRRPSRRRRRAPPFTLYPSSAMKRAGSTRAASPTNTTYSGISNYRTESYRPLRDAPSSQYSNADPRTVARIHFEELSQYLAAYLAKGPSLFPFPPVLSVFILPYTAIIQSRPIPAQLLVRSLQGLHASSSRSFRPMSTMNSCGERTTRPTMKVSPLYSRFISPQIPISTLVPFLPVRDDFHPKRNQARQKLATLPNGRFKDLSSDVYYELARRYPEFKEEVSLHLHTVS